MKNKFLLTTIVLVFLIVTQSCSPKYLAGYKELTLSDIQTPHIFPKNFSTARYKTKLKIMGRELSGLALIKKTSKNTARIVYMSELGMKYFDIEILNNDGNLVAKTHYLMSVLNRGAVQTLLENDFKILLSEIITNNPTKVYRNKLGKMIFEKHISGANVYCFRAKEKNLFERLVWHSKPEGKSEILLEYKKANRPFIINLTNKKYALRFNFELRD